MNIQLVDDDTHVISCQILMSWMRIKGHLYLLVAYVSSVRLQHRGSAGYPGMRPVERNYHPTNDLCETKV